VKRTHPRRRGSRDDRPTQILAFAYACEPDKGGEPGAGWTWARMLGRVGQVVVLTRKNNRASIDKALPSIPERDQLHFEYVDLPWWMRTWKQGPRGAHIYYFLWQLAALKKARSLTDGRPPDIVWHLTWANAWLGTIAPLLPYPFVYGPVGGGVGTPWRLSATLGWRGFLSELARALARASARYLNPLARLAWRKAAVILVQNPETSRWFPSGLQWKAVLFPNVVLEEESLPPPRPLTARNGPQTLLYVGRLLPLKGVSLAIRTLTLLPGWELLICGAGPDLDRLKKLGRRLRVDDRIRFLGALPRDLVRRLMRESADVLVFPSLHDEGGFVVVEALAAGLPVVCLDRGGPRVLGGNAVPASSVSATVFALARAALDAAGTTPRPYPGMQMQVERIRRLLSERIGATASLLHDGSPPDDHQVLA
jgi:glycosyltransferase involved in cell wall biosynthesis